MSKEKDPYLFWEGAFHLAKRLERDDQLEASLALLECIAGELGTNDLELRNAVDRSTQVLLGQGQFGDRFEFMVHRLTREFNDPWAIAAFGAGSLAFRATRLATLSGLWNGSSRAYLLGRPAVNLIAAGAGLSVEAPVFLLTSKLGHQIGGKPQNWGAANVGEELAGVGLTLALLKSSGALGREASVLLGDRVTKAAMPQVAMVGGIFLAQRAEELLGLRQKSSTSAFLADGLATYLHLVAGGRMAEGVLGTRFQSFQRRLDWQTANLFASGGSLSNRAALAMATAGPALPPSVGPGSVLELKTRPFLMEGKGDGGGSPRKPKAADPDQQVVDLSLRRMLRSRPMDKKKEDEFRAEVENMMFGSAAETRRQTLDREVIAKFPTSRREELLRNLQNLHPELVDLFGGAAEKMPWQDMAQVFVEMKLMRSSPGELKPSSLSTDSYSQEVLAAELRLDHGRLFGSPLPGAPEALTLAISRLSGASIKLLEHWAQSPGTRLLMGQRLSLPGLPAESDIVAAYQKWLDRPPESE